MKFPLCFLLIIASYPVISQDNENKTPDEIRPAFIGLFVHDIDAMKEWYETKLGFKAIQYKKLSDQLGFAMMEWNGIWIEMIQNHRTVTREDFQKSFPGATEVEGFFKLGFYTENLEQLSEDFKKKGIEFKYELMNNDNLKMRLFVITDPEGNWIQFYKLKN